MCSIKKLLVFVIKNVQFIIGVGILLRLEEEEEEEIGGDGVFRMTHGERVKFRVRASHIREVGREQFSSCLCILAVTSSL